MQKMGKREGAAPDARCEKLPGETVVLQEGLSTRVHANHHVYGSSVQFSSLFLLAEL